MKKRISIIALILTAALLTMMLLTACGEKDNGATPQEATKSATQTTVSATAAGTAST